MTETDWKSACISALNENSILWNEISIMREQGAKPSDAFEDYVKKKHERIKAEKKTP